MELTNKGSASKSGIGELAGKVVVFGGLFMTPKRFSRLYLQLSMLALIEKHQEAINGRFDPSNVKQVNQLLKCYFDESISLLPRTTMEWLWSDEELDTKLSKDYLVPYTVREVVSNKDLLTKYMREVHEYLLNTLPVIFKVRLQLKRPMEREVLFKQVRESLLLIA